MERTVNKKIAIITGASSGMGREFVRQVAKGCRELDEIWVIARRRERLEQLQSKIAECPLRILVADLATMEGIERLRALLEAQRPRVHVLVNAAGYGMIGQVAEMSLGDSTGMIDLNCRGLTAVTQVVLPYVREGGHIIMMASSAAFCPQPKFAVYAASKAYVESYSRALNRELRHRRIRVTAVCPGPVATEFFGKAETYHSVALYKKLTMAKADRVVSQAMKDAAAGKDMSVYGWLMKGFRILCKVLPRSFIIKFIR